MSALPIAVMLRVCCPTLLQTADLDETSWVQ